LPRGRTLAAVLAAVTAAGLTAAPATAATAAPGSSRAGLPRAGLPAAAPLTLAPVNPAAAPQGPLPQTGCLRTGTAASCDLWAKTGTVTLPGAAAPVPIWGFAATAADPAAVPGPVLVVSVGDTVTITIHNGLAQPLSLALPAVTGVPADLTGAAPGASRGYTFTAGRPGTFLYEAGHTPDGARQVAMGLVGALLVRPPAAADGSVSGYGDATSTYQDEAVLVLSEVDPALNTSADPLSFDLRTFAPKYRLINGRAFPETQRIATDVGRKVLLRYVNAGVQTHSMSLLGVGQYLLATNARPRAFSYPVAAETIPPGATLDTLVTLPTGADGSAYPLYEAAGQLNNAGQRYGAPVPGQSQPQAFGGMLTFLDTNAVPPTGDVVGPVPAHVALAPATPTAVTPVTVTADFSDVANGGSVVTRAEYVIDSLAIAEGTGTPFNPAGFGTGPTVAGATATIGSTTLQTLAPGRHVVYVRAQDAANNWGPVGSAVFTLAATGPITSGALAVPDPTNGTADVALSASGDDTPFGGSVTAAEYFLDALGVTGTGTALALNRSAMQVAESGTIPAAAVGALAEGHHTVYLRSRDSLGLWGPPTTLDLVVDRTSPALQSGVVNPSPNNGTQGSTVDPTALEVAAGFVDPVSNAANSPIADAEGFLDAAGATGTGFPLVARDGSFNSAAESTYGLIPLSELTALADGTHHVLVHARDAAGNWGPLTGLDFVVDRAGPAVAALTGSPNPTAGAASLALTGTATDATTGVAAAEWFTGTDPGAGNGTAMTVTATGPHTATVSAAVPLAGRPAGALTLRARARDAAGNWGPVTSVTVTVQPPNAIFANGFETGNVAAWSASAGTVAVTAAAARTGSFGLAVTRTGAAAGYVQDNTPNAERGYHAQFQFLPNTLTAATVTLLEGRTATGQLAFVVQFRVNAGARQVRVGALRAGGTTYSAWSTLPAGTVTLRVDWTSAVAGSTQLRVNGGLVGTVGVNTSAYALDAVRLGATTAGAGITGTAYFDTFVSTRYTLP
jgi:hypothetical protein